MSVCLLTVSRGRVEAHLVRPAAVYVKLDGVPLPHGHAAAPQHVPVRVVQLRKAKQSQAKN
jgi:hypothetical protein